MAVTITRSVWIDDDGTGTTGTVINQALHTTLYNEIDAALAKVAQLAGGNTFTGTQTITDINSTGALRLLTTSVERLRILSTGELLYNATSNPIGPMLWFLATTPANTVALGIQNTQASNALYYMGFYNSAGGTAGYILQTGATAVQYSTVSDARLKDDAGRATDLSALRAVVIHDFTWTADGLRDRGVFAQEAHGLYPRAITEGSDDLTESGDLKQPWGTDYSKFVPDLIVGFQQHDAELAELRALLATVKGPR
jgi:hypothetical protein